MRIEVDVDLMQRRPLLDDLVDAARQVLEADGTDGGPRGRPSPGRRRIRPLAGESRQVSAAHRPLARPHRRGGVSLQDLRRPPSLSPRPFQIGDAHVLAQADDARPSHDTGPAVAFAARDRGVGGPPSDPDPPPARRPLRTASSREHPGSTTSPAPETGRSCPMRRSPSRGANPSESTSASHSMRRSRPPASTRTARTCRVPSAPVTRPPRMIVATWSGTRPASSSGTTAATTSTPASASVRM